MPTAVTALPTVLTIRPVVVRNGEAAAATAASVMILRCAPSSMSAKPCVTFSTASNSGSAASTASVAAFTSGVPMSSATAVTLFCRISSLAAMESFRLLTSSCSAVFSRQPSLDT